jgi:hypothetical protein
LDGFWKSWSGLRRPPSLTDQVRFDFIALSKTLKLDLKQQAVTGPAE